MTLEMTQPKSARPATVEPPRVARDVAASTRRSEGRLGEPVSRIDGRQKVMGLAQFAGEVPMDDLTYAALVHSSIARGRIATIDVTAAQSAPGVVLVMTHENAPLLRSPSELLTAEKAASPDGLPIMQDDQIHWNGQAVAIVLADTQEDADHAASLVDVTYEASPEVTSFAEAKLETRVANGDDGSPLRHEAGDAEAALRNASVSVDNSYGTPPYNHNALELHAATLRWRDGDLDIHDCTQTIDWVAWSVAEIFGLREEQVHVSAPFVGGAFGGKLLGQHLIIAAAASRIAGRPVRVVLSREGVYRTIGGRAETEQRVAIGAHPDGRFSALIHRGTVAASRHNMFAEPFIIPTQSLYAAESMDLEVRKADLDIVATGRMRAPGEAVGSFALEAAVDELAAAMAIDPIELRLRNEPLQHPITGRDFSSRHLAEAFQTGAERFGWAQRDPQPGVRRDGEWLIGLGCASAIYPYMRFPGSGARIVLAQDSSVTVELGAQEMGMGTTTALSQLTADQLGLPLSSVTCRYGSSSMPGSSPAIGSQQTAALTAAVVAARQNLLAGLLALVEPSSPLAGLSLDDVEAANGGLCKIGDPNIFEDYGSILERADRQSLSAEGVGGPPLEWVLHYSMHSYGAVFCEVRVNSVTAETRVTRIVGAYDCGRIFNPKTAASQIRGGIIMGLGLALTESTDRDERNGRIVNSSLANYHVPVHLDVPDIDVVFLGHPDPQAPAGGRGVGEIGVTGVVAAITNAIYNATGTRVRELPVTVDKLLSAGLGNSRVP